METLMRKGKIFSRFMVAAVCNSTRNVDVVHLASAQQSIIGSGEYMPEDVEDVIPS
ncbi:MAG: hypothetical protein LUB61_01175 [Eggerthellaceae bacterium]|nr:hypothetical protein [Eggerthellaceae bacterium]